MKINDPTYSDKVTKIHLWNLSNQQRVLKNSVLRIRIRMDPELLPGSGSGIKVPDPDPAKSERAYK